MDHMKATVGNSLSWLGVLASFAAQVAPFFQIFAAMAASAASIATFVYFYKKSRKL